ncbi:hypothetical protein ACTQ49_08805 [Luteococcus sp. Sow4_B9]|uniref:hypothetical protein n=1 Tax=Luteococcus sp. Sow4_B9 TaxID=3438792 RepID=UPI003F976958
MTIIQDAMASVLLLGRWADLSLDVLVVVLLGALVTWGGGPIVQIVFRRVDRRTAVATGPDTDVERSSQDDPPGASSDGSVDGLVAAGQQLRGGSWIGALERLAIYAGLVAHYPEAIPISLALKGVARYPELKATTAGAAERFIIGTFVSVLLACGAAGLALWLLGLS